MKNLPSTNSWATGGLFESVTEEEIINLWRSIRDLKSEDDAWHAIVAGIALDMAFAKTTSFEIVH